MYITYTTYDVATSQQNSLGRLAEVFQEKQCNWKGDEKWNFRLSSFAKLPSVNLAALLGKRLGNS